MPDQSTHSLDAVRGREPLANEDVLHLRVILLRELQSGPCLDDEADALGSPD
jgi:hypothetical protein